MQHKIKTKINHLKNRSVNKHQNQKLIIIILIKENFLNH